MNLTRIQRPWLVTSCEWNDKLIRSAIVWLCQLTGEKVKYYHYLCFLFRFSFGV